MWKLLDIHAKIRVICMGKNTRFAAVRTTKKECNDGISPKQRSVSMGNKGDLPRDVSSGRNKKISHQ